MSMWWRIAYGVMRIILGITFLKRIGEPFAEMIYTLMSHELSGSRGDAVLEYVYTSIATHEFTVTYFIASYFIFWGMVDIVLSLCLLRHKLFVFPLTIGLIMLFIGYSCWRLTFTHSFILFGIICIDVGILYIIYRQYRQLRSTK